MSDSTQTTLLYVLVAACIAVCFLVPDIGFAVLALFYLLITPLVLLFDPAYFQPQLAAAFVFAALGIFLTLRTVRRKFDLPFFFSGMFYGVVLIIFSAAVICVNCPKYWIPTVVICAAYLYYLYTRHKAFLQIPEAPAPATPKPAAPVPADPPASAAPPAPAVPADPIPKVPFSLRGAPMAYHYDDVFMDSPDIPAVLQSFDIPLSFRPEADAIAIYANDRRLGVLAHSRLVDMIRDWIDRDDPLYGVLTSYTEATGRVTFGVFFYRAPKVQFVDSDAESYRLIGNCGKEMQSNLDLCTEGDECTIEWDDENEKYRVEVNTLAIGYLPASATNIVEELGPENCRVFIAEIGTDDQSKNAASVHIFELR